MSPLSLSLLLSPLEEQVVLCPTDTLPGGISQTFRVFLLCSPSILPSSLKPLFLCLIHQVFLRSQCSGE